MGASASDVPENTPLAMVIYGQISETALVSVPAEATL